MSITTQGTILSKGDSASPIVYTAVGSVTSISGPNSTRSEIDVTTMDSTAKEFNLALLDHGTLEASIVFDERNTAHAALRTDFVANTVRSWKITDAGSPNKNYVFLGRIQSLPMDFSTDEVVRVNMTIRITGAIAVS